MLAGIFVGATTFCAVLPAALFCVNLRRYRVPPAVEPGQPCAISVLIPARNEEANIADALRCVLASCGVAMEVLVLDDDSTDRTGEVVTRIAASDSRVRLVCGRTLPPGWNGKQHACWVLAQHASSPLLAFLDADVRVEPELLVRMAAFQHRSRSALVSGFPQLITVSFLERLLLPLIHFVLLGFLPMGAMRRSRRPSFAAGCGQFLLMQRDAYFASGGHSAIRETMHDGLLLPRVFRRAGYGTDIADITQLASVRMYDSAAKVWSGLAKNATEGIATVGKIVPLSLILILGQVVPALLMLSAALTGVILLGFRCVGDAFFPLILKSGSAYLATLFIMAHGGFMVGWSPRAAVGLPALLALAVVCVWLPRLLAVQRFRQPLGSALLHPLGVLVLLAVQWYALGRKLFGKPVGWRQRTYSSTTGTQVG